ncbi:MAG: MarR family transcriptional regulator [Oscillospiraceae bacterium]|nr:MarR family transcriptional regulator [Oscillospiraceae bacterium]
MDKQAQLIGSFRGVINKLEWLNKQKMELALAGYKSSEIHCIEYIGKNADSNVTKLAEAFYMTSGAISKLSKKLIAKGLLKSYQKPENKKEVYFRLTEQGRAIFEIHEGLHEEFRNRDNSVFAQISEAQMADMLSFAKKYSNHLDAEIKKIEI